MKWPEPDSPQNDMTACGLCVVTCPVEAIGQREVGEEAYVPEPGR